MRGTWRTWRAAGLAATFALVTACSSGSPGDKLPTIEPATPAASPPASAAGTLPNAPTSVDFVSFDATTGLLAAVGPDRTTVTILTPDGTDPPRTVTLPAPAADLSPGNPGEVLVPAGSIIARVDLATGTVTEVAVEGDAKSVALDQNGDLVVGDADGTIRVLGTDTAVTGLVSADAIAAVDANLVVLDRRQSSVTEIPDGSTSLGLALRAGDGATNLVADHWGRVLVTDTTNGALLVFTTDSLVLRQRYPVGSSPYAVAVDERSGTVWVSLTATNEVLGYDLSSGIPVEIARHATVGQPNSLAVDPDTGDVFVGSAAGDGVQRIAVRESPTTARTAEGGP